MPGREYEPRPNEPSPQEKTQQALQTLERGIDSILSSESFASYLRTMSRFHRYSFGNTVLIHMQRPDATLVAGYRRWQELGRQVQKGVKGIKIFVPHKVRAKVEDEGSNSEDRVFVRSFGIGTVFDVADTDGLPIAEPPAVHEIRTATDRGAALHGQLTAYLEQEGITVTRKRTLPAYGWWEPGTRSIAIGEHLEGDQQAKTLAHEAAHFVAGHELSMPKEDVETIAESAAFVVLSHFDIDTSDYSFVYVARWAKDRAVLKRNLDAIQKTASRVIEGLESLSAPFVEEARALASTEARTP